MKTPLVDIAIPSIYKKGSTRLMLPSRMAKCTPDTFNALQALSQQLEKAGGELYLSDLFRSYDMQFQAHLDFKSGKKKAFSPPPGGSLHEAGRAFDLDLSALVIKLADFWKLAAAEGVSPIIAEPKSSISEAWHFECRGSHVLVQQYYQKGFGSNFKSPYAAMAASSILAIGQKVDVFGQSQTEAAIQAGLIRLGFQLGNIDGKIGGNTRKALVAASIAEGTLENTLTAVEDLLQAKFPDEYVINRHHDLALQADHDVPKHIVS